MLKISKGKTWRPVKTVVYGSEGIGKSTFAGQFPDPLFIDTEGGTDQLDVRRVEKPVTWEELLDIVNEVADTPGICGTLVIDTADWAEQMCVTHVCGKYRQASIEGFGYGKGYTYLAEEWGHLLQACDRVIASGKHVVLVAHAKQRKQELPDEAGAFDRWEMKLRKQVAPLLKEWADLLLFLNYKTYVVRTENNTNKAAGGKRVMFTTHHPCWDAKNRHGLPEEMELSFAGIAHIFREPDPEGHGKEADGTPGGDIFNKPVPEDGSGTPAGKLRAMMAEAGITEGQLRKVVAAKGHYPEETGIDSYPDKFITGWCMKHFGQITKMIKEEGDV